MEAFLEMYVNLNANNLHTLKDVYREDIRFVDPAHEILGLDNLTVYFANMYKNVKYINFSFTDQVVAGKSGYVRWEMTFRHGRLAGGRDICVDGVTYIEFDEEGKVYYHRDYFDLGAIIYEHIPLLGRLVTTLKRGLGT